MAVLILVSMEVKDYATWKTRYEANRPMREAAGITERFVGRDFKKGNVVHIGLVAASMEVADRFLATPQLLDRMALAGVANAPEIRFVLVD
ncbi:MAG TPA: hypothetical protein VF765_35000 [Polyangiaceae bacterium]